MFDVEQYEKEGLAPDDMMGYTMVGCVGVGISTLIAAFDTGVNLGLHLGLTRVALYSSAIFFVFSCM